LSVIVVLVIIGCRDYRLPFLVFPAWWTENVPLTCGQP
jgi:hypothetical protein